PLEYCTAAHVVFPQVAGTIGHEASQKSGSKHLKEEGKQILEIEFLKLPFHGVEQQVNVNDGANGVGNAHAALAERGNGKNGEYDVQQQAKRADLHRC